MDAMEIFRRCITYMSLISRAKILQGDGKRHRRMRTCSRACRGTFCIRSSTNLDTSSIEIPAGRSNNCNEILAPCDTHCEEIRPREEENVIMNTILAVKYTVLQNEFVRTRIGGSDIFVHAFSLLLAKFCAVGYSPACMEGC